MNNVTHWFCVVFSASYFVYVLLSYSDSDLKEKENFLLIFILDEKHTHGFQFERIIT